MRRLMLATIFISALLARAGAQAPAARTAPTARAAADTVKLGKYDLEITTDDGTMVGWLAVAREKDKLTAQVNAGGRMPNVQSFTRVGPEYVLVGGHDNFTITYRFKFARDSVVGSMTGTGGLTGTVAGVYKH